MLDARAGDGRFGPSAWLPNNAPGHWEPLLNASGQPILDPTPWVGNVRPFLVQSSSQFRSAPPPALDSEQWATEFNEVKDLGRATGSTRTESRPTGPSGGRAHRCTSWNEVARQLITRTDLDAADSARLLALQNLSGADAAITCWNDKYHYDFWRPWNAIPRASEDGREDTEADAGLDGADHRAVPGVDFGTQLPRRRYTPRCCGSSSATTRQVGPSRSPARP